MSLSEEEMMSTIYVCT